MKEVKAGILEDLYVKNEKLIQDKDEQIRFLEDQIALVKVKNVPFKQLSEEIKINYEGLESFGYSNKITTNFDKIDTLPVISLRWKSNIPVKQRNEDSKKIEKWMKMKMKLDTLLIEYP